MLVAKRRLLIKRHEVPVAEFDNYRSFLKSMQNDVSRYVQTSSSDAPVVANASFSSPFPSILMSIKGLPGSPSSEANRLEADALGALRRGDPSTSANAFNRVVEADPTFTRAWLELATVYLASRQIDSALSTLRKAIDSDPKQLVARKTYALVLTGLRRAEAATDAWRETVKLAPHDPEANSGLGLSLMQEKRYNEALPYLETAAKSDGSLEAQNRLGAAFLEAGQIEKGTSTLEKVVEADSRPEVLNDISYELAEANASLSKALEYAQLAVDKQEKESFDISLSKLLPEDLTCTLKISTFWDTLGWIHFRLGHVDQAESYIHAAWLLSQAAVVADHLGQVFERQKKTEKAIHMYRLALQTPEAQAPGGSWEETRHRLEHLTGTKSPSALDLLRGDPNGNELSQLRSVKIKRLIPGSATAEFFLLFGSGPKVEDVKFISGSESLRSADQTLLQVNFQVSFPEHSAARLVRRAILVCSGVSGCQVVLFTPDSVHSVK